MRALQSDYMHWAKFKPPVRFSLTGSEVPHVRLDKLPWTIADLDLDGASHPRYLPLRQAIADRYEVTPEQVVTADGASMANFVAMAALIEPGDEVLVERPTYEPLLRAASFLGAEIRRFDRSSPVFALDPDAVEAAATSSTRLIVLSNLHNPSGTLASDEELAAIGEIARARGAQVLVDEVYVDAATPRPRTCVQLGPEFVATNSLTKVYGLSGLRCGWVLAQSELAEHIWRVNDLFGVNQAHSAERLACIAFEHIDAVVGDAPALLGRNRDLFNHFLGTRDDLECAPAIQGLTAFPRWAGGDAARLDALLRDRFETAVVPGHWFELPDHFRIGFGVEASIFSEALTRLGAALDTLR